QLTELRAAISQMKEDISGLANLVGEHQTRLFHLGDTTKPIPSKIFQELSLSEIFSGVVSSVVVGYIQQYPNSVKSDESILSYVNVGIRVGTMILSELIKRSEEAHRQ